MEILQKFKQNGYFTSELYHLLAKKKLLQPSTEITPSEYEREMKMSTQQRLQNLNNIEVDNLLRASNKETNKPVLSFTPRLIVFQNFKPNDKIVAKFSVKNISKGPTFLNMVYKESSYFFIKPCGGVLLSRLAPGISVTFAVTFMPVQYEDYTHKVSFYTDVDQYVLPLIAMGPRPIFDFPDRIDIPQIPLKVENHVLVPIHNIGMVPAGFTFNCKCPFSVLPKSAYLNPKQKIDVKVTFKTMHLGETRGILNALFETGENFVVMMSGKTYTVSIELEKQVVRFFDTYNTMMRQQTFKITNKSDHVLTYMCMKNDCVYYDFEEKVKLATIFYNLKSSESTKYTKLVRYDVLTSDEHERVYTRIFYDEIQALVADESLHFQNTHFTITPIAGKLWPNKSTELSITFCPKEIGEFNATAYLDIDGSVNRVPLKLIGISIPPSINLNVETLDLDCVYINKTYNYEVVAINKGHINGVIVYKEVPTLFGSTITCSPELNCLRPGDKEIFIVSFSNSNQGPFFEEINFTIRDTDVVLKLYLKGEVIYPSLTFSIPCLDFGIVSVGVPKTMELDVINESVVQVSGTLKISSDGPEISSITLTDYAVAEKPKPEIPQWPREFKIEPCKVDIDPESRVSIQVTLIANLIRANQTSLELELEKSDSPPIIVPVMFNAMVPEITPAPEIRLRACFLDFPYENEIVISSNNISGYFTLEESLEQNTLDVNVKIKEGFIQPSSRICLPVSIKTSSLGLQNYVVRIYLFGMSKPIEICQITGFGVRPIVTCTPMTLHWGQVKLLSKSQKALTLCNDSPVYVHFKASLLSKDGRWQISPTEGYVEPESETDLVLTLYLIDADTYTNKAVIQLEKVKEILVPLSASGVGTSIVVGELRDRIVLGKHFTKIPLNSKVIMENCGTRLHALEWSEHYKAPKTKQPTAGFFSLDPKVFKISAGEKLELSITGISYKVTTVKEMWYLVGSVEGINKKELLLECQIVAEFVDPKIEISTNLVEFQYDFGPYSEYYKLTDIVTIKNVSKLPLDIEICAKPPFAIIQKQSTYKIPQEESNLCCCIRYRKSDLNLKNIINEVGPAQSRTFIDFLTSKPVEPLRKGPLHFFHDINKIKMAFNLTHALEERLEDQEIMKLQILFDTTKHLNLKSKVYCDVMKIKFKGHKNKDALKLIGKINFPNILVLSPRVDFQCILNGSIESKTIKIQNATPLLVCYRFQWKKCSITKIPVPELTELDYGNTCSLIKSSTEEPTTIGSGLREILPTQTVGESSLQDPKLDTVSCNKVLAMFQEIVTITTCEETSQIDEEVIKMRMMQKIAPMIDVDYDTDFEWSYKFAKLQPSHNRKDINDVLQLVSHRGLLKPNEIQNVHVIFRPKPNINVRAILECEVLGGPPETILITGSSSDLMYKINSQQLNFKIRSFHEHAHEDLIITNIAQLPFTYRTYLDEPKFKNELEGTILELLPSEKLLEPEEEISMKIVIRPGVVGYYRRTFLLEIGHLPHIPIEIFGWGVIPQVFITLYKPESFEDHDPEIGYVAIPTLTQQYLAAVSEIFSTGKEEHLNSPLTDKCFEDPDFQDGWHICSSWDGYPTIMDIELAKERISVIQHIRSRPEILTAYSTIAKMGPIPGYLTVPYVIDYGVVITGSTVQCTAEVVNYGPIVTKLHFAKGTSVPSWLGMKLCGKLNPGETGKIEVTFSPTSNDFTELEQHVETSFNVEVPYGVTIPIQIKALCAVPYLVSNVKVVDFGSVRCGDKIICSIPLKNVGRPTCIWYVTLRLKAPGPIPMMVLDSSGKYEPGQGGWLSVAFKPTMEMLYEGLLIFRFHMNPNRMTIPVTGQGIVPHVHIIGPNVNFPPTLPWADTTDIYFGLTNPCPFPVELIIAHSDEKWKEEEDIFQLLYKYYNKPEEMLVPALRPGAGLPREIINFCQSFNEHIKKVKEEEAATNKVLTARVTAAAKVQTRKAKSPKSAQKTAVTPKETPPMKVRTESEIVADEIKELKERHVDPLSECLHPVVDDGSEGSGDKHAKGILVFFHGSPCEEMQGQELAYALGKRLQLPTINMDLIIVEALCVSECEAKMILVSAIDENYEAMKRNTKASSDFNENEHPEDFDEYADEFEIILKKIVFLANTKNMNTPRSKASEKKKRRSPTSSVASHTVLGAMGSTTLFQMDLVEELLTDFFTLPKFHRGFVVDTLSSIVVKNPPLVLMTLIKCKRHIWNIHLVLCHSDFSKWAQAYDEAQKEAEAILDEAQSKVYNETEIQEIVTNFDDMDAEDYENSVPELKALYISIGLDARRKKYLDKIGYTADSSKKDKSIKENRSKSLITVDASESKKKIKKEDPKAKATSEYAIMNTRYNEYTKVTYEQLINIANNWILEEADLGAPLFTFNGTIVGVGQKKIKKKSELQLQVSEVSLSDRGFPITFVVCPCLQYKNALVNMFVKAPVVKDALKEEEELDVLKCPVNRKEFTVLLPKTFPSIHHEKPLKWWHLDEKPIRKCECNQLTDLNLLDDTTQDNVLNILSKWHCTCGRKVTSTQTSTSEIPSMSVERVHIFENHDDFPELDPLPLCAVKSTPTFGKRLVLQPGDLIRCKYSFSPQDEGNFSLKRYVEVNGWPESRVDINVNGICDLPRLDSRPKKMFENFVRRTLEDNVYKLTYLDDLKVFEFGPIFTGNHRIYEEHYTIDLKNSSLMTADVVIEFLEDTTVFQIDKNFISLEPGCRGKLTISAAPTEKGVHTSVLLFCVKDNPEIVMVNIACSGVVPVVEILPLTKVIEYGKLLLYRREDDRFIVKNDSILPIMWKIRNGHEFIEDFIIAQSSGIVARQDNQVVPVTYIACRVGVIQNKPLVIDIYDAEGRGDPMVIDTLFLSAECYDVMVECAHENPSETYLNYGNVKVNSTIVREMYLLNRGKYNIYYKLKKVKNFPEPSLLRSFEAIPECGVVPASLKLVSIEFECTPTTSMNLVNVPAYICSLLDGSKDQVVVAKFPVCVTIASFYNTFTLFPLGELNFHIIPVGSGIMRDVILNNTSKCPVTYEIILPAAYQVDPLQPSPPSKEKSTKIRNPPLKCGNFLIMNEDNLLAPGTSRTIQIQFFATAARKFEETINFIISDTCPAEAQGVPLRLVGTGAMPTLDLWNIETTFREHLIVKNLCEYKVHESSPHCVFAENSVTLHFFCVTVGSSHMGNIDLYNNGLVACALTMKLHYQTNASSHIFTLDKYETHIEPLLHKNLGIIFTPKALREYRAVLEIKLKLLDNQEQSFKICLIGEGVIPRISLIKPRVKHHRSSLLRFPVTCLGSISHKPIRFKNISSVKSVVTLDVMQPMNEERPIFWLAAAAESEHMVLDGNNDEMNLTMKVVLRPEEIITVNIYYNPIRKGRTSCDVKLSIEENPYEYYTVAGEGESFMEDVILVGLEMLSMDTDLEAYKLSMTTDGTMSTVSTVETKKSKSASIDRKKSKQLDKKARKASSSSMRHSSESPSAEPSLLKYILDFGGCELFSLQRRSVMMVNNSEKVYKFNWAEVDCIVIKPSVGYISPGEEKDLEIMFFSDHPVIFQREFLTCNLVAISDDSLTLDMKGATWDNRQIVTLFDHNPDLSLNQRCEIITDEQTIPASERYLGAINMIIVYSARTEYTKYICSLKEEKELPDTFIYKTRHFDFTVENVGNVPMKILWNFQIDDEFPARIDKHFPKNQKLRPEDLLNEHPRHESFNSVEMDTNEPMPDPDPETASKVTLFSGSQGRASVDTWFEVDLPFQIIPLKGCLMPGETKSFTVTFSPLDAFDFKVRLKSTIDNLDPYDQNIMCKLTARSLIPFVHLDIEDSDYLTSGRRKVTGVALPPHMTVLEFNVLGSGCYKKKFNVINPTSDPYEFIFEMVMSDKPELMPVHCNMLKGYVEGGTSTEVTFTFSPTAPGVYESQWKFLIPVHNLTMNVLVVGLVREPDVVFVPTILIIRNSLVGFTSTNVVILKNNETEPLKFEFKGNSLCNESGKTPVICEPNSGTLKPRSETPINIVYTPIQDGPLSYKIFCSVTYLTKHLTLCVNALSYSIKPKVLYYLIGNEHILSSEAYTNIHLDQTASTYERTIPFTIRNDGSATFFFDWNYNGSNVKKFMQLHVDPKSGHVTPGSDMECTLFFTVKQVPVQAFPVTLTISDGPEYKIFIHADIEKPLYHFSCMEFDFGKCFVNAPDSTYKRNIALTNDDKVPIIVDLNFSHLPELFVDYEKMTEIEPGKRLKIGIYFRPKQVKEYEFTLQFWVNSLCEENLTVKGEGIPLLFDLYEGCQKSFDLGHVKVGEKLVRTIEVMNHSKATIDATFIFRDMYPVVEDTTQSDATSVCLSPTTAHQHADTGPSRVQMLQTYKDNKVREQIAMDIQNALSSLKVIPNKCLIRPYRKVPLKIQFKPVGMISTLNVQLNMKVFQFERPLVRLSGCATGMSLAFSQNSLQFGRVRKRGCKILKVMLLNKGDFGARFWWQPLISDEFTISPQQGTVAAHTNVTFTITFRPVNHNPFIKVWASCNIENYKHLELALYATCVDLGNIQNKTLYMECPVRDVQTSFIVVTNPTDDLWFILSEVSGGPFDTLREFNVEPNSTFDIPVSFKPKSIGKHESQVLYSPLGESALFVTLLGVAQHPNPNGTINLSVAAKEVHLEELPVYNITEFPESYRVTTELVRINPEKFEGYYEIKCPDVIKTWGEAAATCRWTFVCFEECEMALKVMFINEDTREYQYYNIDVVVTHSPIVDTLTFVSRARESVQKDIVIKNPLSNEADYYVTCEKLECPDALKIGRNSEAILTMTYSPLVEGETEDFLEVNNYLVGTYVYRIKLKCLPAKVKNLEYTTSLGTNIAIRLKVMNQTDSRADFDCTVSHPSIIAEKEYSLGAFEKGKFLVWFEPTELGVQNCRVAFTSLIAGEFIYSIKGIGTEPKPRGPYEIKSGGSTVIRFKNIFDDTRMFKIYVDRDEFYVKTLYEPIRSKKELRITVHLAERPSQGWPEVPTGTLTIENYEPPIPKVSWTFFLQGKP
ncbi:hydrocephalus-inducing protein-like isoform X2 [Trichoplusia ni]|uniref:Hydrocephalus-inducing protein-like isoform X2 n=1 Tax=Trichoplusia ni TaxID=7111 RepID=A0A7E5VFH7_TRINI|nr:hydrocephalus-inducing protein-like isoform X2 [Trichoplusia ni]